jgi:DNA-binding LacI/PurR family transcriptional regulator
MKRPTHRDIASIAGLSHVAVSLALRGHRSIPAETRERIEEIAKKIGYRPDPALQALMVYRRGAKPSHYQGTLAWINNYQSNPDNLKRSFPNYFLGAQERCAELGYQLEEFRLADLDMNFSRLSKVLRARNIQGLLFAPQEGGQRHITRANFDWENFSLLAFGFSLMRPKLDVVTNAQFRSTRLAVRKLRSLGYRRIGFVIESRFNERNDQNFLAGFFIEQRRFLPSECVPIHLISQKSVAEREQGFRKWFLSQSPDVVLSVSGGIPDFFHTLSSAERKECGLALMDLPDNNTELSGISQNNWIIGRVAVDTLVAKIHANERGIPTIPRRILIEGKWMIGTTAPRITGKIGRPLSVKKKQDGTTR